MHPQTHLALNHDLCGTPLELAPDRADVELLTTPTMSADAHGLVHGGFVFGLADHAAMLAVNHPNVVLGSASVRFLAPVRAGETLLARATVRESTGKKRIVDVEVLRAGETVAKGDLICLIPDQHVFAGGSDARR